MTVLIREAITAVHHRGRVDPKVGQVQSKVVQPQRAIRINQNQTVMVLAAMNLVRTSPIQTDPAATFLTIQVLKRARVPTKNPAVAAVVLPATAAATTRTTLHPSKAKHQAMTPSMVPVAVAADPAATMSRPMKAVANPETDQQAVRVEEVVMVPAMNPQLVAAKTSHPKTANRAKDRLTVANRPGSGRAVGNCMAATAKMQAIHHQAVVPMTAKW
jgi:hypothetical protein